MFNQKRLMALCVIMLTCLLTMLISGCGNDSSTDKSSDKNKQETSEQSKAQLEKMTVTVFFPDSNGMKLVPVTRKIEFDNPPSADSNKYLRTMQELVAGPNDDSEGYNVMPQGSKVLDVTVGSNGLAIVNFNENFKRHFHGGSTEEKMLIGAIVNTLTQFDEVQKVQIKVENKVLSGFNGNFDLSKPLSKFKNL